MFDYAKYGGKCVLCGNVDRSTPWYNRNLCKHQWNASLRLGNILPPLNCIEAPFCDICVKDLWLLSFSDPKWESLALRIIDSVKMLEVGKIYSSEKMTCDCGAIKANTTHSNWCSVNDKN